MQKERIPCYRCKERPAEVGVWQVGLCHWCHADWMADERFTVDSIASVLQKWNTLDEEHGLFCAEARRRTLAWLKGTKQ